MLSGQPSDINRRSKARSSSQKHMSSGSASINIPSSASGSHSFTTRTLGGEDDICLLSSEATKAYNGSRMPMSLVQVVGSCSYISKSIQDRASGEDPDEIAGDKAGGVESSSILEEQNGCIEWKLSSCLMVFRI